MLVNISGDFGCFDYFVVLFFGLSKAVIFHAFEEWLFNQIRLISLSSEGLLSCFLGSVIVFYSK